MKTIHKVKIDLLTPGLHPRVYAVQDDICTREVQISLYSGSVSWTPTSGAGVAVGYRKSDGTVGIYDTLPDGSSAVSISGNVVTVILAAQMLTAAGTVEAAVTLAGKSGNQITTFAFDVIVSANPGSGAIKSEDYFNYVNPFITEALENVEAAAAAANGAADRAEGALATAEEAVQEAVQVKETLKQAEAAVVDIVVDATSAVQTANAAVETAEQTIEEVTQAKDSFMETAGNALEEIRNVVNDGTDAPPIVSNARGEVITLDDSADRLLRGLKVFGKTEQRTTTGKNFLNMESGSTQNGNVVYLDGDTVVIKPSTYVNYIVEVTAVKTENIVFSCDIVPETNALGLQIQINGINKVERDYTSAQKASYAFQVSTGDVITIKLRSPNGGSGKFKNCMIESGSTATAYEPYTGGKPSPSPEYPQELESVGDSVNVTVCGKNLISFDQLWFFNNTQWAEAIIDGQSVVTVDVSTSDYDWATVGAMNREVSTDGVYSFSAYVYAPSATTCRIVIFKEYDQVYFTEYAISKGWTRLCVENASLQVGEKYSFAIRPIKNTDVDVSFNRCMVELSASVTEYEPYKAQTLTVSAPNGLPGIPVESGGNYTDPVTGKQWICDEVDFEKGVYVQRVGKLNVYDSEVKDWGAGSSGRDFFIRGEKYDSDPYARRYIAALCSSFPYNEDSPIDSFRVATTANSGWQGYARITFRVPSDINTVALFKEYVGENCEILYQLKDENPILLTAEQLATFASLHSNYPNTTVFNDKKAGMEVKYVADTKLYIDRKFNELAAALVSKV